MTDSPMGLPEIAQLTDPFIPLRVWQQWHRRGHLVSARWRVNGKPAWPASDVAHMLDTIPLHWRGPEESPVRCGVHACEHCADGDLPESWSAHWAPSPHGLARA